MEDRMDYIEQLMIARLSGNIEQKDSEFLDEMIEADADVAKLWQEHQFMASQLKTDYNKEAAWNNVQAGIQEQQSQKRKKRFQIPVFIVLVIVAIVSITLILRNPTSNLKGKGPTAAANLTAANTIRFSTGEKTISIDRNLKSDTTTEAADISIKDGALVFIPKANTPINTISILEVPQGLDRKILLSDGTIVWVNAATKISFPLAFSGNTREVSLDGEAYFEVAKNKAKPYIVHTKEMDVQVLGTHFNIKAYAGEQVQTSLTEGSVEASHQSQKLLLTPGNAALYNGNTFIKKEFDETSVLAWMKGAYYFDNESLTSISHTVDRWFGYRFTYSDPSIAEIQFSGALEKAQTLEVFLDRLSSSANLKYFIQDRQITLQKK